MNIPYARLAALCGILGVLSIVLVLIDAGPAVRAPVVLTFLLICPGLAIVPFLKIADAATELSIAVALSIAIDGLVTLVQAYSSTWDPTSTFLVIGGITFAILAAGLVKFRPARRSEAR